MAQLLLEGEFCDAENGEVYGIVNHKIEPEPNSVCNQSATSGNATISN